jgi:hypothetical protein
MWSLNRPIKDHICGSLICFLYLPLPRIPIHVFVEGTLWIFLNNSSNVFFTIHPQPMNNNLARCFPQVCCDEDSYTQDFMPTTCKAHNFVEQFLAGIHANPPNSILHLSHTTYVNFPLRYKKPKRYPHPAFDPTYEADPTKYLTSRGIVHLWLTHVSHSARSYGVANA